MSQLRPGIIFDIDGMFNPLYAQMRLNAGISEGLEGFARVDYQDPVTGYRHSAFLNPEVQNGWLDELAHYADFVWGSAWEPHANALLTMLGREGEEWPQIEIQHEDVGMGTWKIKSVRSYVEENFPAHQKVVWVEDEIEDDAYEWAEERGNMLIIKPVPKFGLRESEYQEILNFVKTSS